jgi:tetratricopeptide (TPR) repeat protein
MKKGLMTLGCCLFAFACFSQITRKGIVQTYQGNKQVRTEDFLVKYFSQKDSVYTNYTDYDGTFKITFYKKPNYPVALFVYPHPQGNFANYKVVNTYDINNISEFDNSKIEVFVADKKIIRQQRDMFYEIISSPIKKYYQDSIISVQIIYQDSIKKLNLLVENLEKELTKKDNRIKELSEQLDQTSLELTLLKDNPLILHDETYQSNCIRLIEAHNYFSRGLIDSAKLCIPKNIDEISDLNIKESKMLFAFYQLDALIEELQGNYTSAIEQYHKALQHTRGDVFREYITYINIAELESILNNPDNALDYANRALKLEINDIYKIKLYNLKGDYWKAIRLYTKIKKENCNAFIEVADKEATISYMRLAGYYAENKQFENAKTNYLKAIDIYIALNKEGEIDRDNQRLCLLYLAYLYQKDGQTALREQCMNKVSALNRLFAVDSVTIVSNIDASIKNAMADLHLENREFGKAIATYRQTLDYYREQNEKYAINETEIMKSLFTLGMTYLYKYQSAKKKEKDDADLQTSRSYFTECQHVLDSSKIDSATYRGMKILLLTTTGVTYSYNKQERKTAEKYFNESHKDRRKYHFERELVDNPSNITEDNLIGYSKFGLFLYSMYSIFGCIVIGETWFGIAFLL